MLNVTLFQLPDCGPHHSESNNYEKLLELTAAGHREDFATQLVLIIHPSLLLPLH